MSGDDENPGKLPNKGGKSRGAEFDEDSFEDSEDLIDEDDSEDQDWDSYEADVGDDDLEKAVVQKKKGFFSFNTIVILVAVVFGGAFIAMQLGKNASKQETTVSQKTAVSTGLQMVGEKERQDFNAIDTLAPPPGLPPEPKQDAKAQQGAGLPEGPKLGELPPMPGVPNSQQTPNSLPEPGVMAPKKDPMAPSLEAELPLPAPSPVPAGNAGSVEDVLTPLPGGSGDLDVPPERAEVQSELPLPPLPKASEVLKAGALGELSESGPNMPATPVKKVEAQALDGLPPVAMEEEKHGSGREEDQSKVASDVGRLKDQLSELGDRLAEMEKKIASVSGARPEADNTYEVDALKKTVSRLEDQLTALAAQKGQPPSESKAAEALVNRQKTVEVRKPRKTPPRSQAAVRPSRAPVSRSVTGFEIRSAQPGQAWVARPGDNDLHRIGVGDILPGIGRVTSVGTVNGRWVVEGTQGRLSQ